VISAFAVTALVVVGLGVAERVLRRSRPATEHGRYADWRHPGGPLARPANLIANSRLLRALCEPLPVPAMASDIADVVYVNYLVPAHVLAPLAPRGLAIQRVGRDGGWAVLSFLAYRHGHLGPARPGWLRKVLLSPVQTNWRLYVHEPRTGLSGVYFLSTAIDKTLYSLGGRLLCEGLPMHLLRRASVDRRADGCVSVRLDPGAGSGPDAAGQFRPVSVPEGGPWRPAFSTYAEMLAHVVPQDRALSVQGWRSGVTDQEISLGIALHDCIPLSGAVSSRSARSLVGDAEPFSFLVRQVDFLFEGESRIPERTED
jgi:hypothetical protein